MNGLLFIFSVLVYGLLLVILFIYGVNFLYLAFVTWRKNSADPAPPMLDHTPRVSVQLPLFNELYVAERLIDAVAKLDWPSSLLEIQVLDDSTDDTRDVVRNAVERWRAQGVNIQLLHRTERTGFKAGALAEGLKAARGEFLAYFDSDFVPPPDFLKRAIPYFADPKIAFVQTRWGHVNRDYSLLTFLQSLAIDAHFMVEQFARSRGGYFFNFNGTAGVWRHAAIEDAGGWRADTLTEDLDLSYRAFLKGWKAFYLRDVVAPAELPVTISAFRRQQHRWAKGSLECALRLTPQVWRAPVDLGHKVQATLHLTGYCIHLIMFALMLVYPVVLFFSQQFPDLLALFGIGAFFNITALAPTMYFTLAQAQLGGSWWRKIPAILFITALGAGMMTNTVRAAWEVAFGRGKTFERTPKFGIAHRHQAWTNRRYQLALDPLIYIEAVVALFNLLTTIYALQLHNWVIAIYTFIFFGGVLFVSGLTVMQSFEARSYSNEKPVSTSAAMQA